MSIEQVLRNLVFTLTGVFIAQLSVAQNAPDIVFVDGKIMTVDINFSIVQALAVTGNEISALGTTAEIMAAWPARM